MSTSVRDPDVTVVVISYNQGAYLAEAVRSARAQTSGPVQIVVVDDGSTDDTARVAASLDVEYVRRPNGGPSAARNTGLSRARGHFIVFLDADDRLHPEHNEACLSALGEHPEAAYAYTQWQCFGSSTEVSSHPAFDAAELMYRNYVNASSLIRMEALRRTRWDERLRWGMEDWDLYLSLLEEGHVGVLVDRPLLEYRQRAEVGRTARLRRSAMRLHGVHLYLLAKHRRLYGRSAAWRRLRLILSWIKQDASRLLPGWPGHS